MNTASESGLYGNAGQVNYAAAKAGIASMTIVMARELERIGVRVNAIAPVARTRLTEAVAGDFMNAKEGEFDRFAPENAAAMAVWLASPARGRHHRSGGQGAGRQGAAAAGLAAGHRGRPPTTSWTLDSHRGQPRRARSAKTDTGVPPFMPPVEG